MSVVVNATFKAQPEKYQTLYDTLVAILPDTAKREGAELISCAANPDDNSFVVHEVWTSVEAQQAYLGWRAERGEIAALVAMLREPPIFETLEHLQF